VILGGAGCGYGTFDEVDHGDGVVTRCAHNTANLVALGDEISLGQSIALGEVPGSATDAHLHLRSVAIRNRSIPSSKFHFLTKALEIVI
jgi:murein DD-endopeptidase MepM/ murein hydrolase activator NlpD